MHEQAQLFQPKRTEFSEASGLPSLLMWLGDQCHDVELAVAPERAQQVLVAQPVRQRAPGEPDRYAAAEFGFVPSNMTKRKSKDQIELRCSFCGKASSEVAKLIAGPNVYICNECVDICTEVLEDQQIPRTTPTAKLVRYLQRGQSDIDAARQLLQLGHSRVSVDVARSAARYGLRAYVLWTGGDPHYESFAVLLKCVLEDDEEFRRLHGKGATQLIVVHDFDDEVTAEEAGQAIEITIRILAYVAGAIEAA